MATEITMIELHPAFVWDCENCGRENFLRAVCGNLDEAAFQRLTEPDGDIMCDFVTEPGAEFNEHGYAAPRFIVSRVSICPRTVVCYKCGHQEQTEVFISGSD